MLRTIFLSLLLTMAAGAALAADPSSDQPVYAPPAAWVKPIPIPTALPPADGSAIQALLYDQQSRFGVDGDDYFVELANKILTPQGLTPVGNIQVVWDPDTETLVIHHLRIIRDGQVIDVLAGGQKFLVLRRENNLELAMLDGRLTATIEPEGLQVGDVVDFAYTLQQHDPALAGHSTGYDKLVHPGVASRVYFGAQWPESKPIAWRATDGLPAPQVSTSDAVARLTDDMKDIEAPKPPVGAPARFQEMGSLEFSDFGSWNDVSRLFAPLYQKAATLKPDSPLRAEIAKIAAASSDPKARAMAALRLVEDQTRYVFLGMNDGGLVPADADVTWSRRFGDCKGKATLLVAVLRGLGIQADPVLASSTGGDGMDQRLPSASRFDHVIVRVQIAGKTYWLDGTRGGDRDIDDLIVPPFRWVLPATPEGSTLVALVQVVPPLPQSEQTITIDAAKVGPTGAPTHIQAVYRNDDAAVQRQVLQTESRDDWDRLLKQFWMRIDPWLDVSQVVETDDPADHAVKLDVDGTAKADWTVDTTGNRFWRLPNTAMGAATSFKRQPGPHQDAPYAIAFPLYSKTTYRITLPSQGRYVLIGSDIDQIVAGYARERKSRIDDHVLIVEMTTRSITPEVPYLQAQLDEKVLAALATNGVAIVDQTGKGFRGPAESGISDADEAAAAKGDAAAQFRMGRMYETGAGLPLDRNKALDWLTRAADQDYAPAQTALGEFYAMGYGGQSNYAEAVDWYRKGAGHNDPAAEVGLAYLLSTGFGVAKDENQAFALVERAAHQGFAVAEGDLGAEYESGRVRPVDYGQALIWLRKAAAQDDRGAENTLGAMYHEGKGVARNDQEALNWYSKSADQNFPAAEVNLAGMYLAGVGVAQDYAQAMSFYRRAADRGFGPANYWIGNMYSGGQGVPKDDAQAVDWYRKGAAVKDSMSELALANALLDGRGVAKDVDEALVWLRRSSAHGNASARIQLGLLSPHTASSNLQAQVPQSASATLK